MFPTIKNPAAEDRQNRSSPKAPAARRPLTKEEVERRRIDAEIAKASAYIDMVIHATA
jgi:hypothetical protein